MATFRSTYQGSARRAGIFAFLFHPPTTPCCNCQAFGSKELYSPIHHSHYSVYGWRMSLHRKAKLRHTFEHSVPEKGERPCLYRFLIGAKEAWHSNSPVLPWIGILDGHTANDSAAKPPASPTGCSIHSAAVQAAAYLHSEAVHVQTWDEAIPGQFNIRPRAGRFLAQGAMGHTLLGLSQSFRTIPASRFRVLFLRRLPNIPLAPRTCSCRETARAGGRAA